MSDVTIELPSVDLSGIHPILLMILVTLWTAAAVSVYIRDIPGKSRILATVILGPDGLGRGVPADSGDDMVRHVLVLSDHAGRTL